jgi:hypothetical protein
MDRLLAAAVDGQRSTVGRQPPTSYCCGVIAESGVDFFDVMISSDPGVSTVE